VKRIWPALGRAATVAIIYLGLPLLGWGVWATPGFLAHPTRLVYIGVVAAQALFGGWVIYTCLPPPPPRTSEAPVTLARWHSYLFETIAVLAAYGDPRSILAMAESAAVRWAGLALYFVGVAVMSWATQAQFKNLPAAPGAVPELLTAGPYRWVRHPHYLAMLFDCLGFALLFRSWLGLGLAAAQVAALAHRIEDEEEVLARRHGVVWAERARASWKLIPGLY
jgi:protein-S-isoprenylcysteine O-methyltransferase Ste14